MINFLRNLFVRWKHNKTSYKGWHITIFRRWHFDTFHYLFERGNHQIVILTDNQTFKDAKDNFIKIFNREVAGK